MTCSTWWRSGFAKSALNAWSNDLQAQWTHIWNLRRIRSYMRKSESLRSMLEAHFVSRWEELPNCQWFVWHAILVWAFPNTCEEMGHKRTLVKVHSLCRLRSSCCCQNGSKTHFEWSGLKGTEATEKRGSKQFQNPATALLFVVCRCVTQLSPCAKIFTVIFVME